MANNPSEGETVFVTVGTAMPRDKRALVKGTVIKVDEVEDDTFVLEHEEVLDVGSYGDEVYSSDERAKEAMSDGESGPYGDAYGEEKGEVWAYTAEELQ